MLAGQVDRLDEQLREGLREVVQYEFNFLPELLGFELDRILLEYGMRGLKDTVDDMKVSGFELGHHVVDEVLPLCWEILLSCEQINKEYAAVGSLVTLFQYSTGKIILNSSNSSFM